MANRMLTPQQAAKRLGVAPAELRRLVAEGWLTPVPAGPGRAAFRQDDVDTCRAREAAEVREYEQAALSGILEWRPFAASHAWWCACWLAGHRHTFQLGDAPELRWPCRTVDELCTCVHLPGLLVNDEELAEAQVAARALGVTDWRSAERYRGGRKQELPLPAGYRWSAPPLLIVIVHTADGGRLLMPDDVDWGSGGPPGDTPERQAVVTQPEAGIVTMDFLLPQR